MPILGTWDDHDYGLNDADRTFAHREASKYYFYYYTTLVVVCIVAQH